MVTLTDAARRKVLALIESEGRTGLALRFWIEGRGPGGFGYHLGFVTPSERGADDLVIEADGFDLLVDAASAPNLKGATIDYVETLQESGFKIENPNSPWTDPLAQQVQKVLDQDINPAVASHGGYVVLHDVKDGVAYVQLHGGCQGCGMAAVTLRHGIEVRIKETVPGIREVVDVTDHASGERPYYAAAEEGRSPLE